ncbi:hypothetical protein ACJX0J_031046, partial [Zea mays]
YKADDLCRKKSNHIFRKANVALEGATSYCSRKNLIFFLIGMRLFEAVSMRGPVEIERVGFVRDVCFLLVALWYLL